MHYHQRNIMKQQIVNAGCAIRRKNTQNIMLHDAQHLHHLNTLTDTIRLLTGTVTIWTHYEYAPERVINVNSTIIMWDVPVITDPTVLAN